MTEINTLCGVLAQIGQIRESEKRITMFVFYTSWPEQNSIQKPITIMIRRLFSEFALSAEKENGILTFVLYFKLTCFANQASSLTGYYNIETTI